MSRLQRRAVKVLKRTDTSTNKLKPKVNHERIVEALPPKTKGLPFKTNKPMMNKSCYFSPDQKDFSQLTENIHTDQYQSLLLGQYGFNPVSYSLSQLKDLTKVHYANSGKVENSSQYDKSASKVKIAFDVVTSDGTQWQKIENADEIDKYIRTDKEKNESNMTLPQSVHIPETPRIKIIAEKFIKFKKNNIELRKLDEKVVCVEYDIYKGDTTAKPVQKMRAFFSVKPQKLDNGNEPGIPLDIFSNIKEKFVISDEDLERLKNKEIEIIDGQIPDNRPYLDDLKRVLKRKRIINTKKNRTSLDLLSLYEMAKRESPPLDENFSDTNLLSKAELDEIKEIIIKKCTSSVHGISRRRLRKDTQDMPDKDGISESLLTDLLREEN